MKATALVPETITDESLLRGVAARDERAVAELLDRYWPRAFAFARKLLGDAHAAEDATQEAFIRATRAAPRFDPSRRVRPWLFRIVENAARENARARRRRSRREARAARPAIAAPADDAVDREMVDLHLARLDPDLRAAVVLHFLEGMTYRELADTLGCPEGTAASRVRRGVEALRASLPRGAVAGVAALGALIGRPPALAHAAPSAARVLAGAASGAGAGKSLLLTAAALALIAAAIAGGMALGRPDDGTGATARGPVAPPTGEALADARGGGGGGDAPAGAPSDRSPVAPDRDAPAAGTTAPVDPTRASAGAASGVDGTIVGGPLRAAWVMPLDADAARAHESHRLGRDELLVGWRVPEGATAVGESGRFSLDLPPGEHRIAAGAAGFHSAVETVRIAAGERAELAIAPTWVGIARATVTLLDRRGEPIASTPFSLSVAGYYTESHFAGLAREARTDAAGTVALELIPGELTFSARLDDGRRETGAEKVTLRDGDAVRIALRLHGNTALVRVRDARGEPVPGAIVAILPADPQRLTDPPTVSPWVKDRTDDDGHFLFGTVDAGAHVAVARLGFMGGRSAVFTVGETQDRTDDVVIDVTLDQPIDRGHLRLIFVDGATGDRLEGQHELQLARFGPDGSQAPTVLFADGKIDEYDLRPGTYRFSAWGERWGNADGEVAVRARERAELTLTLPPAARIAGVVLGPDGGPLAGAQVHLIRTKSTSTYWTTTARGAFALGPVAADRAYVVDVSADGLATFRFEGVTAGDAPVELRLPPTGAGEVRVRDARGRPVAQASVTIRAGGRPLEGLTDADGRLRLLRAPGPGRARLSVYSHRHESHEQSLDAWPDRPVEVTLADAGEPDPRSATVRGRVVTAAGRPVAGARVRAGYREGRTDARGEFSVDGVQAGRVRVIATRGDLAPGIVAVETQGDRTRADVEITLVPGARVAGRAAPTVHTIEVLAPGAATEEAVLVVVRPRADGRFDLGRLAPGAWTLVLEDDAADEIGRRTVTVRAGVDLTDLELDPR